MPEPKPTLRFLSIQEICDITGKDRHTVKYWIDTKQLKATNLGTDEDKKVARWGIRQDWFDAFIESRTSAPEEAKPVKRRTAAPNKTTKVYF